MNNFFANRIVQHWNRLPARGGGRDGGEANKMEEVREEMVCERKVTVQQRKWEGEEEVIKWMG